MTARGGECAVRFRWMRARGAESAVLTDMCLAWVAALAHRGTAGGVGPTSASDGRRAPGGALRGPLWSRLFQGATAARNFFAPPISTAPARPTMTTSSAVTPQLIELATRQQGDDARDQVKAGAPPVTGWTTARAARVASELASSPRTLQRRLRDLGASYHQVLEQARRVRRATISCTRPRSWRRLRICLATRTPTPSCGPSTGGRGYAGEVEGDAEECSACQVGGRRRPLRGKLCSRRSPSRAPTRNSSIAVPRSE